MPTDHLMEGEDAVENDLESEGHQAALKNSSEASRENKENAELETEAPVVDKAVKVSCQRSSNRLTKRARKEQTVDVVSKKTAVVKQESTPSIRSKTRRPWELWSVEDKNAFFEALCEYGKDFESIQSYIAQRSKKKGVAANMIKNKDQVRHFYYRTWHKISKFLEISECVQKQTQELYGLINYAELRKKIGGCLNEKNRQKLNELVFSGVTTVKHKGKKLRIKTPVCRALKKLNNVSDTKEPDADKLPKEVIVEFRPFTNAAWLHVQNLAQNPRVRTKVCLQKRLQHVIEHLQRRWTPYRLKRKEQILNSLPNYNSEELSCDTPPVLRVKPPRNVKIYPLTLSVVDTASSSDVCLEKYMKLSHKSLCKDVNKSKKVVNSKPKSLNEKIIESSEVTESKSVESSLVTEKTDNATDNSGEQCDIISFTDKPDLCQKGSKGVEDTSYINVLTPPKSVPEFEQSIEPNSCDLKFSSSSLSAFSSLLDPSAKPTLHSDNLDIISEDIHYNLFNANNSKSSDYFNPFCRDVSAEAQLADYSFEDISMFNNSALVTHNKDFLLSEHTEKDKHSTEKSEAQKNSKNILHDDDDSMYTKIVKQGWTVEEAGFLTFGELYLLLGKPTTIILEYEFESPDSPAFSSGGIASETNCMSSELNHLLKKVYEVAQSYFVDPKQKQLTGKQSRGSSSKSSKLKSSGLNEKASKDFSSSPTNPTASPSVTSKDVNNIDIVKSITTSSSNDHSVSSMLISTSPLSAADKHVFVMPVGTAPRTVKHPNQNSLKEEIGKLLPCTRRGCRVRRKPLVVQRPLLPREGMRPMTGPRPMTVVHLVPSVSPITTVIPSSCARSKSTIPAPKKVVNILPPAVDMHSAQVPVIKQLHPDSGQSVILQKSLSPQNVSIQSSGVDSLSLLNSPMLGSCPTSIHLKHTRPPQDLSSVSQIELNSSSDLNTLNLNLLPGPSKTLNDSKDSFSSLSQLSLSDASNLVSSVSPTFLDEFGLSSKNSMYDSSNLSTCLNVNVTSKDNSAESSSQHPFQINSSEIQWLNSENSELSLNSFLNSIESPTKISTASTTENSNLDPIVRLAGDDDSQVRCLLDEYSIDFITKFEELSEVINNTSSNDSKQT